MLDALVRKRMAEADGLDAYRAVFLPFPICRATCKEVPAACDQAREIADDVVFQRVFSRVVLSTIEDGDSLDRTWIDVEAIVQSRRPPDSDYASLMRCLLIRGSHWLAARRGRQANWTYADVVKFSDHLTWMLLAKLSGHDQSTAREGFRAQARRLHARTYPPYSGCNTICRHAPLCVYRHYAADLIAARTELAAWTAADKEDAASADGRRAQTWRTSLDSATRLIEFPEKNSPLDLRRSASDAARRVALCFAQQMATDDPGKSPAVARRIVTQLQREAGDLVKEGVPR